MGRVRSMETPQALITRADDDRLPEGCPAQLIEGHLLREPAPVWRHACVRMRLARAVMPLVADGLLGMAPIDVHIDAHNVYQPDIAVLGTVPPDDTSYVGTPLVVFEILSPSTAARDREVKAPRLLELGACEVWLVAPSRHHRAPYRSRLAPRTCHGCHPLGGRRRIHGASGRAVSPVRRVIRSPSIAA